MPQTPSKHDDKAHALLIGVDDYRWFDESGLSSLQGSRNDAVLVACYCVGVLGIPAENIRVLTWPRLTDAELQQSASMSWLLGYPDIKRGDATQREVGEGLDWLLDASKRGDGAALFAFSGHGAWSQDKGPLLCLGDAAPGLADGVLALKGLRDAVAHAGATNKLIALLDCCHVARPHSHRRLQGKALPHAGTADDVVGHADMFNVSDRVVLAAGPGKEAYQMLLGGQWHGALTFALVTAAERWLGEDGASHGAYKQVLKRTKRTLEALEVPQTPAMQAPAARWVEIRRQPFMGVKAGHTVKKPDAVGRGVQLDPNSLQGFNGTVYTLELTVPGATVPGARPIDAPVLSVGTTSPDRNWVAGNEYWALPASFAALWNDNTWPTSPSTPTLSFTAAPYRTGGPPAGWNSGVPTTIHGSDMRNHWTTTSSPPAKTLFWESFGVSVDSSGAVTWYCLGDSTPPTQSFVVNGDGATFTTTQPTSGTRWWVLST